MKLFRQTLAVAALVLGAGFAHQVSAQKLDIKPGLWEVSTSQPRSVNRVCYTAEVLNAGFAPVPTPPEKLTCNHEWRSTGAKSITTKSICDGLYKVVSDASLEITSAESMTMTAKSDFDMAGEKHTVNMTATYRWLGADCGAVAPAVPKPAGK